MFFKISEAGFLSRKLLFGSRPGQFASFNGAYVPSERFRRLHRHRIRGRTVSFGSSRPIKRWSRRSFLRKMKPGGRIVIAPLNLALRVAGCAYRRRTRLARAILSRPEFSRSKWSRAKRASARQQSTRSRSLLPPAPLIRLTRRPKCRPWARGKRRSAIPISYPMPAWERRRSRPMRRMRSSPSRRSSLRCNSTSPSGRPRA